MRDSLSARARPVAAALLAAAALAATPAACSSDGTSTTSTPTTVTAVSGSAQTAAAGAALASPFVVRVTDQSGTAMSGVAVTWAIASGGGSLGATSTTTDAAGQASTTYTAGTTAGTATITATVSGLAAVSFTATVTVTSAAMAITVVSGSGQSVATGAAAGSPFVVKVVDQSGAALAAQTVTWAVTGGGGTLSAASSTTDASGQASTTYTAGATAGTATVTATVGTLSPATFTTTVTSGATGSGTGSAVIAALDAFKATLSATQVASLQIAFTQTLASRWSNLPCALTCRNGLLLGSLSAAQQAAALGVAKVALSDTGFARFQAVRAADDYLAANGGGSGYGSGLYIIAVLGTPSTTGRWMLQFGGHHYAYNMAFNGTATPSVSITGTPFHIGVEPQAFTLNGVSYAPLQKHKVAMYTMINALDATQKAAAQLSTSFDDVLLGPGKDWQFPTSQGLVGSSLTAAQRALVKTAIEAWVNDVPSTEAAALLADYEADTSLAKTYVAWSKSTDSTVAGSYVRIDGPRVWIEFVCQQGVVFRNQIHFHTIWRDRARDYGGTISTASIETAAFARELAAVRSRFTPPAGTVSGGWPAP